MTLGRYWERRGQIEVSFPFKPVGRNGLRRFSKPIVQMGFGLFSVVRVETANAVVSSKNVHGGAWWFRVKIKTKSTHGWKKINVSSGMCGGFV